MKTHGLLAGFVMLSLVAAAVGAAGGDDEPSKASFWMKKKLSYSENILAGLASADFDAIGKNAQTMKALSQMEKWVRGNTPQYRAQLQVFHDANDRLIRMADNENLDGAALAYVQLTLSCVNCHKVVRDSQREEQRPSK